MVEALHHLVSGKTLFAGYETYHAVKASRNSRIRHQLTWFCSPLWLSGFGPSPKLLPVIRSSGRSRSSISNADWRSGGAWSFFNAFGAAYEAWSVVRRQRVEGAGQVLQRDLAEDARSVRGLFTQRDFPGKHAKARRRLVHRGDQCERQEEQAEGNVHGNLDSVGASLYSSCST